MKRFRVEKYEYGLIKPVISREEFTLHAIPLVKAIQLMMRQLLEKYMNPSKRIKIGDRVINPDNIIQAIRFKEDRVWIYTIPSGEECDGELMLSGEEAELFWEYYTRPQDCVDLMRRSASSREVES